MGIVTVRGWLVIQIISGPEIMTLQFNNGKFIVKFPFISKLEKVDDWWNGRQALWRKAFNGAPELLHSRLRLLANLLATGMIVPFLKQYLCCKWRSSYRSYQSVNWSWFFHWCYINNSCEFWGNCLPYCLIIEWIILQAFWKSRMKMQRARKCVPHQVMLRHVFVDASMNCLKENKIDKIGMLC